MSTGSSQAECCSQKIYFRRLYFCNDTARPQYVSIVDKYERGIGVEVLDLADVMNESGLGTLMSTLALGSCVFKFPAGANAVVDVSLDPATSVHTFDWQVFRSRIPGSHSAPLHEEVAKCLRDEKASIQSTAQHIAAVLLALSEKEPGTATKSLEANKKAVLACIADEPCNGQLEVLCEPPASPRTHYAKCTANGLVCTSGRPPG